MTDKKLLIIALTLFLTFSCENYVNTPSNITNIKSLIPKNTQGPNSTGGLFTILDKEGKYLSNKKFSILSQKDEELKELGQGFTDNEGQSFIPENIINEKLVKELKNGELKLIILVGEEQLKTIIEKIDFISDKFIHVKASIEAPKPLQINLSQKSLNIEVGYTSEIIAEVLMSDGEKNNAVTWTSSDESIAIVKNGKISALKKGSVIITARASSDLEIYNRISLTVTDNSVVTNIKIIDPVTKSKIENLAPIKVGNSLKLEGVIVLSDGSSNSSNILWKSSDESIAIVGKNNGLITGVSKGKVTITAYPTEDISKSSSISLEIIN